MVNAISNRDSGEGAVLGGRASPSALAELATAPTGRTFNSRTSRDQAANSDCDRTEEAAGERPEGVGKEGEEMEGSGSVDPLQDLLRGVRVGSAKQLSPRCRRH